MIAKFEFKVTGQYGLWQNASSCDPSNVKIDGLNAVDRREVVFLVLLDLSAAFDTISMILKHTHTHTESSDK